MKHSRSPEWCWCYFMTAMSMRAVSMAQCTYVVRPLPILITSASTTRVNEKLVAHSRTINYLFEHSFSCWTATDVACDRQSMSPQTQHNMDLMAALAELQQLQLYIMGLDIAYPGIQTEPSSSSCLVPEQWKTVNRQNVSNIAITPMQRKALQASPRQWTLKRRLS